MHPAVQEALSKAETKHENNPRTSAWSQPKVLSKGNKSESNRPRKQQREPEAMASQKEEGNLLAELTMEEKALPSPVEVTPVRNVNVELDHLRSEIARLRQQQDGIRPVVVEANHIPLERQELEFWMNHRQGDFVPRSRKTMQREGCS